jgi:uncharacterized protein YggE
MKSSASKLVSFSLLITFAFAAATHAAEADKPRTVSVSGQAEIIAEPDRAWLTLGAEARKPKAEDARAEVQKTIEAVLKLTRDLKIDPKYVHATAINVQPEYNWQENRERTLLGYLVSRSVEVDLRDFNKLGPLIERALDLGVNEASAPRLDSTRRRELEREAVAKALEDARLNAEAIAKAAGAKLGQPRTISANSGFAPAPVPTARNMMAMAKDAGAEQSYQSGQMTFNGNVQVEYDLIFAGQ